MITKIPQFVKPIFYTDPQKQDRKRIFSPGADHTAGKKRISQYICKYQNQSVNDFISKGSLTYFSTPNAAEAKMNRKLTFLSHQK